MTVAQMIRNIERSRPGCNLSLDEFLYEMNKVNKEVFENILSKHEGEKEYIPLLNDTDIINIPDAYTELFKYRILAFIDMENGDITRYSNDMILYNNLLSAYGDWYTRTHMPKQKAKLRWV